MTEKQHLQKTRRGFLKGAAAMALMRATDSLQMSNLARIGINLPDVAPETRMQNTIVPGMGDREDFYIYDTMTVAPNTAFPNKTSLFNVPQQGSTKNLAQTDMDIAATLVAPQVLIVKNMRVFILNNITPTDMLAIYTNVSFTFRYNKKPIWNGVAWMLPAGGGMFMQASQVGTAPSGSAVALSVSNGWPDISNSYARRDPITINSGEPFSTDVVAETPFNTQANSTNPPGTGVTIVFALEGTIFLPVG